MGVRCAYDPRVAEIVRLTVVSSQAEADMITGLLRANGIECADRPTAIAADVMGVGGWTEVLVNEDDLDAAQALLDESTTD